jgi:hypothetical protein
LPSGTQYSDYLFWDSLAPTPSWTVQSTSIHIGANAGKFGRGNNSVAIGNNAGVTGIGNNAISIGNNAGGPTNQGANSIQLNASGIGPTGNQGANSILLNATNNSITTPVNSIILAADAVEITGPTGNAFYVAPIRGVTGTSIPPNLLGYNNSTSELTWFSNANYFSSNKVVANSTTSGTIAATSYTSSLGGSPGTNPSVTITTGTAVFVTITGQHTSANSNTELYISFDVTGASNLPANDIRALIMTGRNSGDAMQYSSVLYITGLNAGNNTFSLSYRVSETNTITITNRVLIVERYN